MDTLACCLRALFPRCRRCFWPVLALLFTAPLLSSHFSSVAAATHGCAPDPPQITSTRAEPALSVRGSVLINEVLNQPASSWNCSDAPGSHSFVADSWIELYNPQRQALDLYAVHAKISLAGAADWYYLPSGSIIAADSFLVLFPLKALAVSSPTLWNLTLTIGAITIDQVSVPALQPDQSYARVLDGSKDWQVTSMPSIALTNGSAAPPPTATPARNPGGSSSQGRGGSSGPATAVNRGTQPVWSQLHIPVAGDVPASAGKPVALVAVRSPVQNSFGKNLVLALGLLLLLSGAFLWYWLRLHAP